MKPQSATTFKTIVPSLLCSLAMLLSAGRADAQLTTNNYLYAGNQAGSPGTNWSGTGVTAYWKLNGAGTAVQPTNGSFTATTTNYNIYTLNSNGVALGAGTATTLIRNPYTAPNYNIDTFPGDSLILSTNTQLRFKHGGSAGNSLVSGVVYNQNTNNFPGNFGLPGMVLKDRKSTRLN